MAETDQIDTFRSHWWWRPGWGVGTRYYSWHLTFDDQPALRDLARTYQSVLDSFAALDPVPLPWLHLTTQGVGHVADVPPADVDAMVAAVRQELCALPRVTSAFGVVDVTREGVEVTPEDREPLRAVQRAIRRGIADALGADAVPGGDQVFWPHVSLAYANDVAPSAPVRTAVAALAQGRADVSFRHATLIEMHRDRRQYEWTVVATAPIGADVGGC